MSTIEYVSIVRHHVRSYNSTPSYDMDWFDPRDTMRQKAADSQTQVWHGTVRLGSETTRRIGPDGMGRDRKARCGIARFRMRCTHVERSPVRTPALPAQRVTSRNGCAGGWLGFDIEAASRQSRPNTRSTFKACGLATPSGVRPAPCRKRAAPDPPQNYARATATLGPAAP